MCRRFLCCRNRVQVEQQVAASIEASVNELESLGSMTKSQSENSLMSLRGLLKLQNLWKDIPDESDVFAAELLGIEKELRVSKQYTENALLQLIAFDIANASTPMSAERHQQNLFQQQTYKTTADRLDHYISMIIVWRQFLTSHSRAQRSLST